MTDLSRTPPPLSGEVLNPFTLAARSKEWFVEKIFRCKDDLAAAEVRLNDAQEKYTEESYAGAKTIAEAEENYEESLGGLESAERKLDWEKQEHWKRKHSLTSRIVERTKYLLGQIDWKNLRKGAQWGAQK